MTSYWLCCLPAPVSSCCNPRPPYIRVIGAIWYLNSQFIRAGTGDSSLKCFTFYLRPVGIHDPEIAPYILTVKDPAMKRENKNRHGAAHRDFSFVGCWQKLTNQVIKMYVCVIIMTPSPPPPLYGGGILE